MLFSLARVLASSLLAASVGAPLDWSPNGEWLAYTLDGAESNSILGADWLTPAVDASHRASPPSTATAPVVRTSRKHRVWASRIGTTDSVLIEESRWPLSAPTWSMDGRSLVFARFVPASDAADPARPRGRYEVVVQSGLDKRRVVVVLPDVELDADQLAAIVGMKPAISPDGRYVALPQPGKTPAVAIVSLEQEAVLKTVQDAALPTWAPSGLRLLFVRESEQPDGRTTREAFILNRDMGAAHPLKTNLTLLDNQPIWSLDGQAILAVTHTPSRGVGDMRIDLTRISLDAGPSLQVMQLEAINRNRPAPQVLTRRPGGGRIIVRPQPVVVDPPVVVKSAVSLDREQENCVALIEFEDQEQAFRTYDVRIQRVNRLFHPLDLSIRISAPVISPDGRAVGFRAEVPGLPALPAVCDLGTEAVTLIAPDGPTRRLWLEVVASTSADLLKGGLPLAPNRQSTTPATILPPPIELAANTPQRLRVHHLAKVARSLLKGPPPADGHDEATDAFRLFFDYLEGDFHAAEESLRKVEARAEDPDARLRWLCLRAQVLLGQGEVDRARGISHYVANATRSQSRTIEMTPAGPVSSTIPNPRAEWSSALSQAVEKSTPSRPRGAFGSDLDDAGEEAKALSEWDEFNNQIRSARPGSAFVPDDAGRTMDGFDRARREMQQFIEAPRPRFAPPPAPEFAPPVVPGLPRL